MSAVTSMNVKMRAVRRNVSTYRRASVKCPAASAASSPDKSASKKKASSELSVAVFSAALGVSTPIAPLLN